MCLFICIYAEMGLHIFLFNQEDWLMGGSASKMALMKRHLFFKKLNIQGFI